VKQRTANGTEMSSRAKRGTCVIVDAPSVRAPQREAGLASARSSAARQAAARSQPRCMDSPPPQGWGAATAAPLIRFARFYEASRPRPRSPPRGKALLVSCQWARRWGAVAAGSGSASPHPQAGCRLRRPRRAVQGATRRAAWRPRERTPQVEPAAQGKRSFDCAPPPCGGGASLRMTALREAPTHDLRPTTYDYLFHVKQLPKPLPP